MALDTASASVLILAHDQSVGMELLPVSEHVYLIGRQEPSGRTGPLPLNERVQMIGRPRRRPIWNHDWGSGSELRGVPGVLQRVISTRRADGD